MTLFPIMNLPWQLLTEGSLQHAPLHNVNMPSCMYVYIHFLVYNTNCKYWHARLWCLCLQTVKRLKCLSPLYTEISWTCSDNMEALLWSPCSYFSWYRVHIVFPLLTMHRFFTNFPWGKCLNTVLLVVLWWICFPEDKRSIKWEMFFSISFTS